MSGTDVPKHTPEPRPGKSLGGAFSLLEFSAEYRLQPHQPLGFILLQRVLHGFLLLLATAVLSMLVGILVMSPP